jgi:hypothetical protein
VVGNNFNKILNFLSAMGKRRPKKVYIILEGKVAASVCGLATR